MNRLLIVFILLTGSCMTAAAQMGAAQRITPAVEKKFVLKAPVENVWEYIMEPKNYAKFAGVKSYTCEEHANEAEAKVINKAGEVREQKIGYLSYEFHQLCFFVSKSPYMEGQWVYAINLKQQGKNCEVELLANTGPEGKAPEALVKAMEQEFKDMQIGLEKKFK